MAAPLFQTPAGIITAAAFLADVHALEGRLAGQGPVLNLCRDRYAFAVAFAACVSLGRTCLLQGGQFAGCTAVTDADVVPAEAGAPAPNPMVPAGQEAAIVFTSGTTGAPVAHRKSWGGLVARSRAAAERFGLDAAAPASIAGTVPPGHMYGFETTVLLPLHAPACSWCGPAFFPGDVQAALAAASVPRILVTTPLQLRALLHADPLPGLHACISATAPLEPELAAEAEARWGAPVLEIFGATECGSIASRRTMEGEDWWAYPGVDLADERGAVWVRAPHADAVALADRLELLEAGRFRLAGRRADLVKMGGRRASLVGLNQILNGLDGVLDGLFVVPEDLDRRSNARLLALVVAPGRSGPSILAELRQRIDPVFLPRRVVRVDHLPRNELGKLPRQAVLALLANADGAG